MAQLGFFTGASSPFFWELCSVSATDGGATGAETDGGGGGAGGGGAGVTSFFTPTCSIFF